MADDEAETQTTVCVITEQEIYDHRLLLPTNNCVQ